MKRFTSVSAILGIVLGWSAPAHALPGQTVAEVMTWMQSSSTIRPKSGEKLIVRKSDSAAQRFIFEASMFAPGALLGSSSSAGRIRSETFQLFDMQNGVSKARLEESLRAIYGLDITQDFDRAQTIYTYPTAATVQAAINQRKPILRSLQGEIRRGARFAYWVEVATTTTGTAYAGRITIFQHQDIDKLEAEIRNR